MTEEKLCGGKTFKEVMDEVNFHIHDKYKIEQLEKENAGLKLQLATSEHDREHNDYELSETYETIEKLKAQN